ncbi:hypothetical protein BD779DRAFT_1521487 [Infundibulicybe gibba]|nr:hypothetical protein BD779DRAFT_1521487 [Infundibulicybe gibba]
MSYELRPIVVIVFRRPFPGPLINDISNIDVVLKPELPNRLFSVDFPSDIGGTTQHSPTLESHSTMAQLNGREYFIKSRLNNAFVGRSLREDKSLLPKAIVSVDGPDSQAWSVEPVGGNQYILSIRGGRTAVSKGSVFAILLDSPEPEKWIIKRQASGYYTIESSDQRGGWILPGGDVNTQVSVL